LTCCAADAGPVKITLVSKLPRKLAPDTRVTAEGGGYDKRSDKDPSNSEQIPYLKMSSLRKIDKPSNPYEE
jgi:putative membrane protein